MEKAVHGHEVLNMLLAAPHGYTRASLRAAILERFGDDTRYFTCSAAGMDVDQLIDFLAARQKFVEHTSGALEADPARICQHDGEHPHEH